MSEQVTVEELEQTAKALADARLAYEQKKQELKTYSDKVEEIEVKVLDLLEAAGKKSYKSEYGTLTRSDRWWVTIPNTPEDKMALEKYLRDAGVYEKYFTVNSTAMNAYFMEEWDNCKINTPEDALEFRIPGLGEPKIRTTLSFRKS